MGKQKDALCNILTPEQLKERKKMIYKQRMETDPEFREKAREYSRRKYSSRSREERAEYNRDYYVKNKDRIKKMSNIYYHANREMIREKETQKRIDNPVRYKRKAQEQYLRRKNDPDYRMKNAEIKRRGFLVSKIKRNIATRDRFIQKLFDLENARDLGTIQSILTPAVIKRKIQHYGDVINRRQQNITSMEQELKILRERKNNARNIV